MLRAAGAQREAAMRDSNLSHDEFVERNASRTRAAYQMETHETPI